MKITSHLLKRREELFLAQQRASDASEAKSRLLRQVISAHEDERQRVARELHDEIGQMLTALMIKLGLIKESLPAELKTTAEKLANMEPLITHTLEEIHKIILDLRPTLLDDLGLVPAIRWYTKEYLEAMGMAVRLHLPLQVKRLEAEQEITLFRIVQEACTNIIRHADAETVTISLALDGTLLTLAIEDDGCGFQLDPSQAQEALQSGGHQKSFGLKGMRERAELLGGQLDIQSQPGSGTRIEIQIPILPPSTP